MMSTQNAQQTPVLTVTQLTRAIKMSLESTFPSVSIQGEISNFKAQSSGHLYFSLKDAGAQISAVMFRGNTRNLKTLPKDGDHVIIKGEINVYELRGNYQIIVRELSQIGLGELLLKLEQLKILLLQRGWFATERKRLLPKFPKTIGIVTSPTGAVIQDVLNILTRRSGGFHLILNPVKVQGEGAAQEIARAIQQFNEQGLADVLIVGRGGGSIEDLWAFNEEVVAAAIYNSKIPIVSAVGHETDHCIADYVADVRAPTPSAAAELVIAEKAQHQQYLQQLQQRYHQTIKHLIRQNRQRLQGIIRQPVLKSPYALLGPWMQKLDDLRVGTDQTMQQRLQRQRLQINGLQRQLAGLNPIARIRHTRQQLLQWQRGIGTAISLRIATAKTRLTNCKKVDQQWLRIVENTQQRLQNIVDGLRAVDPKNLLRKGYSIVLAEKDGSVISSVQSLTPDQRIKILMSDGSASAAIQQISASQE